VVARRGENAQLLPVRAPFDVLERTVALDVVAHGRSVRIGRHLQPHDARAIDIDDDALES
jgi:hypothetical protein